MRIVNFIKSHLMALGSVSLWLKSFAMNECYHEIFESHFRGYFCCFKCNEKDELENIYHHNFCVVSLGGSKALS